MMTDKVQYRINLKGQYGIEELKRSVNNKKVTIVSCCPRRAGRAKPLVKHLLIII